MQQHKHQYVSYGVHEPISTHASFDGDKGYDPNILKKLCCNGGGTIRKEMAEADDLDNSEVHTNNIKELIDKITVPIVFLSANPLSITVSMMERVLNERVIDHFEDLDTEISLLTPEKKLYQFNEAVNDSFFRTLQRVEYTLDTLYNLKTYAQEKGKKIIEISHNDVKENPKNVVNNILAQWDLPLVEDEVVPLAPVKHISSIEEIENESIKNSYVIVNPSQEMIENGCDVTDGFLKESDLKRETLDASPVLQGKELETALMTRLYSIILGASKQIDLELNQAAAYEEIGVLFSSPQAEDAWEEN